MGRSAQDLLNELRDHGETQRLEAKRGYSDTPDLQPVVSAFSNMGGGWVIIGVSPEQGYPVVGCVNPDKIQLDVANLCKSTLNVIVRPEISVETIEKKTVIVVYIPEAPPYLKPVYIKKQNLPKGAYIRIGSSNHNTTDEDIKRFFRDAGTTTYDRRPLPDAKENDLDQNAINAYRRELAREKPDSDLLTYEDIDLLKAINAVVEEDGRLIPSAAGIVLLGNKAALRRLMPSMRVDYIRINGTVWNGDVNDTYTTVEIREALMIGWRRIFAAVADDLPKVFSLPKGTPQRKETLTIPEKALREAIINSIIHRDYQTHGPIQIRRFSDRLEIDNPGYSLVEEHQLGEPVSLARNPMLAECFRELNLAESRGTGIRRIREQVKRHGLPEPIIKSDRVHNRFVITLALHHFLEDADQDWLSRFGNLDEKDRRLLVYLRTNDHLTNSNVRELTGDDTARASVRLRKLCGAGHLVQHGRGRATSYTLSATASPLLNSEQMPGVVTHVGQPLQPSLFDVRSGSTGNANPTVLGAEPSDLGAEPSDLGAEPSDLGAEPSDLGAEPSDLGLVQVEVDQSTDTGVADASSRRQQLLNLVGEDARNLLQKLTRRSGVEQMEQVIIAVLRERPWILSDLGDLLERHPVYIRGRYLKNLQKKNKVSLLYPEQVNHPAQAYILILDADE